MVDTKFKMEYVHLFFFFFFFTPTTTLRHVTAGEISGLLLIYRRFSAGCSPLTRVV